MRSLERHAAYGGGVGPSASSSLPWWWRASAGRSLGNTHGPTTPTTHPSGHNVTRDNFRPGLPVGPYTNLTVAGPLAVVVSGALYVADVGREQILVHLPDGRFRVIAGDGKKGVSGDGRPAIDAEFLDIEDMAVGPDGSLYVVDGDRVRVVSPNGVISTIAGVAGMATSPTCCSGTTLPPPIVNGTPARSVSIDQLNSAAIALSEQGVVYISTGMQLLRLDSGTLDVIATRAIDPPYNGQLLPDPGQIAVDAQGNIDVSGGNGWAIWQVAPNGVATEIGAPDARRSGGDTSVLERAPDGVVYGESGPTFLKLQDGRVIPGYSFPQTAALGLLAHLLRLRTQRRRVRRRDSRLRSLGEVSAAPCGSRQPIFCALATDICRCGSRYALTLRTWGTACRSPGSPSAEKRGVTGSSPVELPEWCGQSRSRRRERW